MGLILLSVRVRALNPERVCVCSLYNGVVLRSSGERTTQCLVSDSALSFFTLVNRSVTLLLTCLSEGAEEGTQVLSDPFWLFSL